MKTKFFLDGFYKLRLDHIQPKEAKPANRIHLKFAMLLPSPKKGEPMPDEMKQAPTQVRRVFELIADTELEMPKALIVTKIAGIDIELFPTPPTSKKVPVMVTLNSCILRDLQLSRTGTSTKGEIRLFFSVGITWDRGVWKWGGDQFGMECYGKFHQSQTALFDEHEADEALQSDPEPTARVAEEIEQLAGDPLFASPERTGAPASDPLRASSKRNRDRTRQGKAKRTAPIPFKSKSGRGHRPHA